MATPSSSPPSSATFLSRPADELLLLLGEEKEDSIADDDQRSRRHHRSAAAAVVVVSSSFLPAGSAATAISTGRRKTRQRQQHQQQQQQARRGFFRSSSYGAAGLLGAVVVMSSVLAAFRAATSPTTTTTTTALYDYYYYYYYYDSSTNGPATTVVTEAHRNLRLILPTTASSGPSTSTSSENGTTTTLTLVEDDKGAPGSASNSDSDSLTHNGIPMVMMDVSKTVGSSIDSRADNNSDNTETATSIRQWGCNLHTAPFVFVHIGKAGGGVVRRRFAYAAVNVTRRPNQWYDGSKDQHYYPMMDNDNGNNRRRVDGNSTTTRRRRVTGRAAVFCSSGRRRHLPGPKRWSMEGYSQPCSAQTVLGHILACPEILDGGCIRSDKSYHPLRRDAAHIIYVGHNFIGTELHWLPIPVLKKWWNTYWRPSDTNFNSSYNPSDPVLDAIDNLNGKRPWCNGRPRLLRIQDESDDSSNERELERQWNCSRTNLEPVADRWARQAILNRVVAGSSNTTTNATSTTIELTPAQWGRAYGQLYASVPVTRVTLLREPWSWLHSKYAWHEVGTVHNMRCDDIVTATTQLDDAQQPTELAIEPKVVMVESTSAPTPALTTTTTASLTNASNRMYANLQNQERPGWLRLYALKYILFLCGEDCYVRLEMGTATLEEVEAQAAYNLRHSFAVVGLLHEQESFLEMVHARVHYMDLHQPYTDIPSGGEHKSGKEDDEFCAAKFRDPTFQQQVLDAAPEMRALLRLYEIGVQVNRFQRHELEQCSGFDFGLTEMVGTKALA